MAILNILGSKTVIGVGLVGVICVVGGVLLRLSLQSRRPKNFPPGPPTIPILGNLNVIPLTKSFLKQVVLQNACF